MPDIPTPPRLNKTLLFQGVCGARAIAYARGDSLIESVDACQKWAKDYGLVDAIGQDAVQAIIAEAFLPYRKDLP